MDEKITFIPAPSAASWETFLANMVLKSPMHFQNVDNIAQNGRQAIKRYYKKMHKGELPKRLFSTRTDKTDHSFSITREK